MMRKKIKFWLILGFCWIIGECSGLLWAKTTQFDPFAHLRHRLISHGFTPKHIQTLYNDPRVRFETKAVSSYFIHRESTLNYNQFLKPTNIRKSRQYIQTHHQYLHQAQQLFGVDKEVITAILLVETRLGTYTGKSPVFNVLSSMAALADPATNQYLWKQISGNTRLTRHQYAKKVTQKSGWAYKELIALLKYAQNQRLDPIAPIGSYAGAMGYCQFMPSNIEPLARDGNGDGKIDLYTHADAIYSIASYLNHYGWKTGISPKKAFRVIHKYNPSKYYVNTILKISHKLKETP